MGLFRNNRNQAIKDDQDTLSPLSSHICFSMLIFIFKLISHGKVQVTAKTWHLYIYSIVICRRAPACQYTKKSWGRSDWLRLGQALLDQSAMSTGTEWHSTKGAFPLVLRPVPKWGNCRPGATSPFSHRITWFTICGCLIQQTSMSSVPKSINISSDLWRKKSSWGVGSGGCQDFPDSLWA